MVLHRRCVAMPCKLLFLQVCPRHCIGCPPKVRDPGKLRKVEGLPITEIDQSVTTEVVLQIRCMAMACVLLFLQVRPHEIDQSVTTEMVLQIVAWQWHACWRSCKRIRSTVLDDLQGKG